MKKLIACLTAITAVMCITTSCGKVEETTDDASIAVESTKPSENGEITEEETESTSEETEETTETTETTEKATSSFSSDLAYASTVEEYVSAVNSKDYEKAIMLMFPDSLAEVMMEFNEFGVSQATDVFDGANCTIVDLKEKSVATDELADELAQVLSQIKGAYEYIAENGEDAFWSYEPDENAGTMCEITQLYEVVLTVANENGDTADIPLMVYNVEGEGWNIDASMQEYISESKEQSMVSTAKSFLNATNTILVEMDCMGVDLSGCFVICSDSSKNISGDFDVDAFTEDLANWFPDYTDYEYILVIDNGMCLGAYCADKSDSEIVGMYPDGMVPTFENGKIVRDKITLSENDSYSLDELYEMITAQAE